MVALSHLFTYFNSRPHGGRLFYRKLALRPHYFNSRPHGGRRSSARLFPSGLIFQLTPSRRATKIRKANFNDILISTHALTEGDKLQRLTNFYHFHFNSRPHGGRLFFALWVVVLATYFNSRPHGGRRQI